MGGRGRGRGRGRGQDPSQGGSQQPRPQGYASSRGRGGPSHGHGMPAGPTGGSSHQVRPQNSGPTVQNLAQRRLEQQMQQLSLSRHGEGDSAGQSHHVEGERGGPSRPVEGNQAGPSRPVEGNQAGPSRPVEGNQAGPSRPVEGNQAGPSRPVERNQAGPSRRVEQERDRAGTEGAAGVVSVGRGSMRGRRVIEHKFIRTKPDTITEKQGFAGFPSELTANYFNLTSITDWVLHQYRVDIAPEEDRTFERRNLLRVHQEKIGGYIFDGTVLYCAKRLTVTPGESLTWTSQSDDGTNYTITVRHVNEVNYGDYSYQQVFNILIRNCIRALGLQLVGRDFYDPDPSVKILIREHRLELWPGYKTSIRQHEAGIFMCAEITHKIMRTDTVLDILAQCISKNPRNYQEVFSHEIIGCIVLTKYNNKTYQITDVDYNSNPKHTFIYKNEPISFAQYMQMKYQIQLRDLTQPLLISKSKARDIRAGMDEIVSLIPEVCYATGLTDNMRENRHLMTALSRYTRIQPSERVKRLLAFNQRLQSNQQVVTEFRKFNMSLDRNLVKIPGRKLELETIFLGNKIEVKPSTPSLDWTSHVKSNPLIVRKELCDWFVLISHRDRNRAHLLAFVDLLKRAGRGMGLVVQTPQILDVGQNDRDGPGEYVQTLTQILSKQQPNLIMAIVPNINGARYSAIKKKCCVDRPVPSQVIQSRNLNDPKKSMSIATKVMIQMNCKLGGAPWCVKIPPQDMMVVGFDVCHDTNNKASSFGAMVASLNRECSRYFSTVSAHTNGEELSNNLALNIIKAVRKYCAVNNKLPAKIVIYRDGVGEGQIPYVNETELKSTKEKLDHIYNGQPYAMAFIIVTKRINTRLFQNNQNPEPGTIADDVITDPEKYDFFLVSQSVRDGTVTPTSYNVIYDTTGWKPKQLQWLTYKLCHLYYNWSGTVRVPAPCQYAHKLAFLVGNSLHREPHSQLEDLLYFL